MTRKRFPFLILLLTLALSACIAGQATDTPLTASGFIEGRMYRLSAEVGGTVTEVTIAQGDTVDAYQPLVRLENPDVQAALVEAQAAVAQAKANLDRLQSQPSEQDVAQARAAVRAAQAQQDAAEAALQALKDAYAPLDPPAADLHTAQYAVRQAEAAVALAQARLDQVQAGPDPLEVQIAQAALQSAHLQQELAQLQVGHLTLQAPIRGEIQEILVHAGEAAIPGQPLVLLLDPDALFLTVYLPQQHLGRVHEGDPVQVHVDAYPDHTFDGTVDGIADQAQFTPTTVQTTEERVKMVFAVRIRLRSPEGRLTPGMPADAIFAEP